MKTKTIISCGTHRHAIWRLTDGTFVADAHPGIDAAVTAFQIAATLSVGLPTVSGCVPLLALLRSGVEEIVDAHGDVTPGWMSAWQRYWKNPLVAQLAKQYTRKRDIFFKELIGDVKKALRRSNQLPLDIRITDDIASHENNVVGFYWEDEWKLPVARDWLATCSADPLRDGKLVLGRAAEAVYVLANEKYVSDAWHVRKVAA